MSTMNQIREGLTRAWDSLTVGWRELRELAGDALTRFQPKSPPGDSADANQVTARAARWGLLAAEVADTGERLEVTLEVPGLEPGDFDLEVIGDVLVIRGEKRVARSETRGHYHITERAYGQFKRAIRLPATVDEAGAKAGYRHGVLTVTLPKSQASRTRRITVDAD